MSDMTIDWSGVARAISASTRAGCIGLRSSLAACAPVSFCQSCFHSATCRCHERRLSSPRSDLAAARSCNSAQNDLASATIPNAVGKFLPSMAGSEST